jgi:hypothetical protein
MRKLFILILPLVLLACNGPQNRNSSTSASNSENIQTIDASDTLKDPHHYYYMADIDPKMIGQMILNDTFDLSDNYTTFRIMDSLLAKHTEDREFYFKVFLKIIDKADGALAEAVGIPAMKYVEDHTVEFIELSTNISKNLFERWASYIGNEIYLSSLIDPIGEGKAFIKKINNNCSELSNKEKTRLNEFNNTILATIQENNK